MAGGGLCRGERPGPRQWTGLTLAFGGLRVLLWPGLSARPRGAWLMIFAGVSWGWYRLRAKGGTDPVGVTAGNCLRTLLFALLRAVMEQERAPSSAQGLAYALCSGRLIPGLGYVAW